MCTVIPFLMSMTYIHTDGILTADSLNPNFSQEYEKTSINMLLIAYDLSGNSYATSSIKNKIDNFDNEPPNGFILKPFQVSH